MNQNWLQEQGSESHIGRLKDMFVETARQLTQSPGNRQTKYAVTVASVAKAFQRLGFDPHTKVEDLGLMEYHQLASLASEFPGVELLAGNTFHIKNQHVHIVLCVGEGSMSGTHNVTSGDKIPSIKTCVQPEPSEVITFPNLGAKSKPQKPVTRQPGRHVNGNNGSRVSPH